MNIITEPWPPATKTGVRAIHEPSGLSVICCDHDQEAKNRAEAVNKLESILKHRNLDSCFIGECFEKSKIEKFDAEVMRFERY